MTDERLDLPQGTLDLILKSLSHQVSRATLQVPQGSLYPALHRLERRGWIRARWGASENNRCAKYYSLTRSGTRSFIGTSSSGSWTSSCAFTSRARPTSAWHKASR